MSALPNTEKCRKNVRCYVFVQRDKRTRELGKNRYRVKVKRFPIQMTTKCHSNWKTSMKYGIGKVIHTVHKPKEETSH